MKNFKQFTKDINEKYGIIIYTLVTINIISKIIKTEEAQKVIGDLKKNLKKSPEFIKSYMTKKVKEAVDVIKNNKGKITPLALYSVYIILIYYVVIHSGMSNPAINKLRKDILQKTMKDGEFYNTGPITKLADKVISKLNSAKS